MMNSSINFDAMHWHINSYHPNDILIVQERINALADRRP